MDGWLQDDLQQPYCWMMEQVVLLLALLCILLFTALLLESM